MAPLDHHDELVDEDQRKPAAFRFWAIRKCDSLGSPAIFTDWDDCCFYVDQSENECLVDYREFTSGIEALKYIYPSVKTSTSPNDAEGYSNPPPPVAAAAAAARTFFANNRDQTEEETLRKRPASAATDYESDSSSPRKKRGQPGLIDGPWEEKFQLFLDFKAEFGDPILTDERMMSNPKYERLITWKAQQRTLLQEYLHDPNSMSAENLERAKKLLVENFIIKNPSPTTLERWDNNYRKAHAFFELYGTVKMRKRMPGYDSALSCWISQQREEMRKLESPDEYSALTFDRARRLRQIGIESREEPRDAIPEEIKDIYEEKLREQLASTVSVDVANVGAVSVDKQKEDSEEGQQPQSSAAPATETTINDTEGNGTDAPETATVNATATGTKRARRIAMWEANFELLKRYKEINGTCQVNKESDGWSEHLEKWYRNQRYQVSAFNKGDRKHCTITETQVQRLRDLGLPESTRNNQAVLSQAWDEMYEELKKFKEEHGHTVVPYAPKSALRIWIVSQRDHYRRMKAGKKTDVMTKERLDKLVKLGLQMEPMVRKTFEERAAEWIEYVATHGKTPPADSTPVGKWGVRQRNKYEMKQKGLKTNLTQAQIDQLNSFGFPWKLVEKTDAYYAQKKSWDERFEELLEYKRQNGHVNVPQLYPKLGNWVRRQRIGFSKLKRGLKCSLTPEKIEKLRSVGFVFLTRKSRLESARKKRELELGLITPDEAGNVESDGDDESSNDGRDINLAGYW